MAGKAVHLISGFIRGEIKEIGAKGVSFSIPLDDSYMKDGEKVEDTVWYNCVAWDKQADVIKAYCAPGDYVELQCKFKQKEKDGKVFTSWVVRPHFDGFTFGPKTQDKPAADDGVPF